MTLDVYGHAIAGADRKAAEAAAEILSDPPRDDSVEPSRRRAAVGRMRQNGATITKPALLNEDI
jgi:hypothetical protein